MERMEAWESHSHGGNGSAGGPARNISIIPLNKEERPGPKVDLEGKVALIVGGTTAKGESLAKAFAERNVDLALIYFGEDHKRAMLVKQEVVERGRRCILISGEGADEEADEQFALEAMQLILETFGRLDIFINFSAQKFPAGQLVPLKTGKETVRSQLFPQFEIMKAALNEIRD